MVTEPFITAEFYNTYEIIETTTFAFVQSNFQGGQDTYSTKARSGRSGDVTPERGLWMEPGQYRPITLLHRKYNLGVWCVIAFDA
jgi:hypothetical protein